MRFHADIERLIAHDDKVEMVIVAAGILSHEIKRAAIGVRNIHGLGEYHFAQAINIFFCRNFLCGVQQTLV